MYLSRISALHQFIHLPVRHRAAGTCREMV